MAILASTIGVAGVGTSAANASGSKSVRTIHRFAHLGPLRDRAPRARAFGAGASLSRTREVSAQHLQAESDGSNAIPHVKPTQPTDVVGPRAPSPFKVGATFNGLNALDSENANLFDLEPPDQGLCVGHGKALEVINSVVGVYDSSGTLLANPIDLNTFYGLAPGLDPNTNLQGPFTTDPSCVFDPATNRFYVSELTIEVDPQTGHLLGPNHIDIAVSASGDPLGSWNVYRIPVQDDGTQGTPNHVCQPNPPEVPKEATNPNACLGDYPQIGL